MNLVKLIKKHWFWGVIILFCLTPTLWFLGRAPGTLINGLDTNFPLNPLVWLGRRFYVWNNIVNAGSDFSSSISGLFFHLIQAIPYILGLPLKGVQLFSMIFWFSAIVFGALTLARAVVPKNKVAQLVFVSLYTFNTYLFNTWENIKVSNLALYASLPFFVAIIYLLSKRLVSLRRGFIYFCLVSILASGAGINPAYFFVILLTIFITSASFAILEVKQKSFWEVLVAGTLATSTLILINLFWILPLLNNLLSQGTSVLSDLGLTNWLRSLSENTSLLNVMRLQGAWDWYALDRFGMPQYLPYTLNYLYRWPFILYSFVFPAIALISLFLFKKKDSEWYLLFGVLAVLGIFLGVGAHEPTGGLYLFLTEHLPFFSFFRSPWYIFTPILTLAYAGLAGLLFDTNFEFVGRRNQRTAEKLRKIVAFGIIVGNLVYSYPLVNGKIFRPGKNDSFYVTFPDYVWEAGDWLSANESAHSRIITYPEDQLETFNWGYRGTESILNLFTNAEVITPSFNLQSKTLATFLNEFYSLLRRGNYQSALSLLRFLATDTIFVKKDVSTIFPSIKEDISEYVQNISFGDWAFMKSKNPKREKIFIPQDIYTNLGNDEDFVYLAPFLTNNAVVVNGVGDTEVNQIEGIEGYPSLLKTKRDPEKDFNNIQENSFSLAKGGTFTAIIEKLVSNETVVSVQLDGRLIGRELIGQKNGFITVGPLNTEEGDHIIIVEYPPAENLLVAENFSEIANETGLRPEELPADAVDTLVAFNPSDLEKILDFRAKNFNPYLNYVFEFAYKYIYGSVPLVEIIQSTPTSPIKSFPVYTGSSLDWEKQAHLFNPVPTESDVKISIKMPPNKRGDRSKSYFENLYFRRVYDNKVFLAEEPAVENSVFTPEITIVKKSPVKYEVEVKNASERAGYVLAFLESYNKQWLLKSADAENFSPLHFKINGFANGWYIPEGTTSTKFTIYYWPQSLLILGGAASLATLILALALNVFFKGRAK